MKSAQKKWPELNSRLSEIMEGVEFRDGFRHVQATVWCCVTNFCACLRPGKHKVPPCERPFTLFKSMECIQMSNDDGLHIWVGDLDGYIDVEFPIEDDEENLETPAQLEREIELELEQMRERQKRLVFETEVGDIFLFSGRSITSKTLLSRGLTPERWRWAQHNAENALGDAKDSSELDRLFVNKINAMGRRYAIGRYARWEGLSFDVALTATFPYGLKALLHQYLAREVSLANIPEGSTIQEFLLQAEHLRGSGKHGDRPTAYERTSVIRQALHEFALLARGAGGHLQLNKESMRTILSLCRLHFSVSECNVSRLKDFKVLHRRYGKLRSDARNEH